MAGTENLQEPFKSIVERIIAESGGKVTIKSGYRTNAEQARLYALYKSGKGNLAAKPGHSQHEHGMAVDFGGDLKLAKQLATKYGLFASVPGEPWHFTMGGENDDTATNDFNYDPAQVSEGDNPTDVLANRLHSIMKVMGLDATTGTVGTSSPSFGNAEMDEAFRPGNMEQPSMGLSDPAVSRATGVKSQFQQYAKAKLAEVGLSPADFPALVTLWNKESGWDPTADNPTSTAYGIAQFLNGTWQGTGIAKTSDPFQQIDAGLQYIKSRYGSAAKALQFHERNNWY